jgi:predicted TIM-barrel fold metal-dependent hydrolase
MHLFDADLHWIELEPELIRRAGLQRPRVLPSDGWDRTLAGRYPEIRPTDEQRREFLRANGIAAAAIHPTGCLSIGLVPEPRAAVQVAEAFHELALEGCAAEPAGGCELLPIALAVPQAVRHTIANLGRYRELGFRGVLLVPHGHGRLFGGDEFRELWERCDDLGLAVTIHAN